MRARESEFSALAAYAKVISQNASSRLVCDSHCPRFYKRHNNWLLYKSSRLKWFPSETSASLPLFDTHTLRTTHKPAQLILTSSNKIWKRRWGEADEESQKFFPRTLLFLGPQPSPWEESELKFKHSLGGASHVWNIYSRRPIFLCHCNTSFGKHLEFHDFFIKISNTSRASLDFFRRLFRRRWYRLWHFTPFYFRRDESIKNFSKFACLFGILLRKQFERIRDNGCRRFASLRFSLLLTRSPFSREIFPQIARNTATKTLEGRFQFDFINISHPRKNLTR